MTLFIDLRATPSGGICAAQASVWEASAWESGSRPVPDGEFKSAIRGRDLLLVAHGFNVSREEGIRSLANWSERCRLPGPDLFIGVLWPGDSRFFPVIDYPFEGDEAIASGRMLAEFLNREAGEAASISFASHSLGARNVLEALAKLGRKARRLVLMAGAIEDDCLVNEYRAAADKAEEIYILASRKDLVLEFAFPIGNPVGEIVMHGHPYFKAAIGRGGPAQPIPLAQRGGAWQISDIWGYDHGDYLSHNPSGPSFDIPVAPPGPSDGLPPQAARPDWKSSWSAAAVSTQVR
jgi:pimeloyl-ACP methyl ester carboxylesterase